MEVSVDSKQNHMSGLAFPLTEAAIESIQNFKSCGTDYVQLSIDLNKEIINVKRKLCCYILSGIYLCKTGIFVLLLLHSFFI